MRDSYSLLRQILQPFILKGQRFFCVNMYQFYFLISFLHLGNFLCISVQKGYAMSLKNTWKHDCNMQYRVPCYVRHTLYQFCGYGSTGSTCFWASRIRILLLLSKNNKKNHVFSCFVTTFWLFIFEKWCVNVLSKSNMEKNFLLN